MSQKCQVCRGQLNSYNAGKLCFPCQKKRNEEQVAKMADSTHRRPEIVCFPSRGLPSSRIKYVTLETSQRKQDYEFRSPVRIGRVMHIKS